MLFAFSFGIKSKSRIGPRSDRLLATEFIKGTVGSCGGSLSRKGASMPFDKYDFENLHKERREAIAKSIRSISADELKKIGEEIFRYADDPWRETYFRFIAENPAATFHHAVTSDGVNIIYCGDIDKGMWFLPGTGMGPLQENGRKTMKELSELHR
jgi:hypothetical protein